MVKCSLAINDTKLRILPHYETKLLSAYFNVNSFSMHSKTKFWNEKRL